jgi:MarR family transcriptional regulator, organic hydroperoxide resistance regulator
VSASRLGRDDLGFLLAKATQEWNDLLADAFARAGFQEVRPSYGSILLPLYEEDGLQLGELSRRSRLSKQTMTALARRAERDGLVERRGDPADARATLVFLTQRARDFEPVAAGALQELDARVRARLDSAAVMSLRESLRVLASLGDEG